jgi:hypothetical protein
LIGVFLCSEAYDALTAAKGLNRRVEEAFRGLENAVQKVLEEEDAEVAARQGKDAVLTGDERAGRGNCEW